MEWASASGTGVFFRIFFFNDTATTEIYTLSLHDALPIFCLEAAHHREHHREGPHADGDPARSEEHTSELQSPPDLVCRLLLEKKKTCTITIKKRNGFSDNGSDYVGKAGKNI